MPTKEQIDHVDILIRSGDFHFCMGGRYGKILGVK
jgi:hypothetical protein